jgi:peptidoglycan/xylan/chitin deacetylase (PgdA/CDA1 family)
LINGKARTKQSQTSDKGLRLPRSFQSLAMTACVLFGGCARPGNPQEPPVVTILCYHTFDSPKRTAYTVTSRRFDQEMRYLFAQKIPVISMRQLTDHLYGNASIPPRSVVITIDDGYRTAKTIAWPILKRYGFPFTVYVYPHAISRLPSMLTWDELREMSHGGVGIGSHSLTHPLLTHPGQPMDKKDYQAWIDRELVESKRRIESELQAPVTTLAYPFGGYDENIVRRAKAAGYKTALTCADGDVAGYFDPLKLSRRLVYRQTSLKAFVRYFDQRPLHLVSLSPRDGQRVRIKPNEIRAQFSPEQNIRPGSAQILVDKLGIHWFPAAVDPRTRVIRFVMPPTSRHGYFFVSLIAEDSTDPTITREASWHFIIRKNASIK